MFEKRLAGISFVLNARNVSYRSSDMSLLSRIWESGYSQSILFGRFDKSEMQDKKQSTEIWKK
jgi:hypothetical protein